MAMRMATPLVTCSRITDCEPSATRESISTPRFIGPGCITTARSDGELQTLRGEGEEIEVLTHRREVDLLLALELDAEHHHHVRALEGGLEPDERC